MSYKFKKKPTIKELASVVIDINNKLNSLMGFVGDIEKAFSLYVQMNKHDAAFTEYIQAKIKEHDDTKKDGDADTPNLKGDTDGEGSGTERVREKAK